MVHRYNITGVARRLATCATAALCIATAHADVIDSYTDGDFTVSPTWGGDTANWTVVASSDAAAGATNSGTLRLNVPTGTAGPQYLSVQRTADWGNSQSWGFWVGRRGQSATGSNATTIVLYANEANLESSTVDGYAIVFGDDSGDDELRLQYFVNGLSNGTTLITSSGGIPNGLIDYGLLVRVTRTASGFWSLHTSSFPASNGTGAIATDEPSSAGTPISQGSATHTGIISFSDGYLGIAASHTSSTAARAAVEFDQFFFAPSSDSPLPVELSDFSIASHGRSVTLSWATASEVTNIGFEIMRAPAADSTFIPIASYLTDAGLAGLGTSAIGRSYTYTDAGVDLLPGQRYRYRLVNIDEDGRRYEHPAVEVMIESEEPLQPTSFTLDIAPNPTAGELRLRYRVDQPLHVRLHAPTGEEIAGLLDSRAYPSGSGEVIITTAGLSSGWYTLHARSGLRTTTRQVLIIR